MDLKLVKEFIFNNQPVPPGGSVPKYPKLCDARHYRGNVVAKDHDTCLTQEPCLECQPRNPEYCTFGVNIRATNTGAANISNIKISDDLDAPLLIHNGLSSFKNPEIYKSVDPETALSSSGQKTLQGGETSRPVSRQLRAECVASNVGTSAQAKSLNPEFEVESNIPKINVTSSDMEVSVNSPALESGDRTVPWQITLVNKGNRAAQNVDVVAKFSHKTSRNRPQEFELNDISGNGVRRGGQVSWNVPQLGAGRTMTFDVEQELPKASGSAQVEVQAKSECDCDIAESATSTTSYAMLADMTDKPDPYNMTNNSLLTYGLTVCNQAGPKDNIKNAFEFAFRTAFDQPSAIDNYEIYVYRFRYIEDEAPLEFGAKIKDSHYNSIRNKKEFFGSKDKVEFQFDTKLKGRHCVDFKIKLTTNSRLAAKVHTFKVDISAGNNKDFTATAQDAEPTTVVK